MIHVKENLCIQINSKNFLFLEVHDVNAVVLYDENLIPLKINEDDLNPPVGTIIKKAEADYFKDLCDCEDKNHIGIITENTKLLFSLISEIHKKADDILSYCNSNIDSLDTDIVLSNKDINEIEKKEGIDDFAQILKNRGISFEDDDL